MKIKNIIKNYYEQNKHKIKEQIKSNHQKKTYKVIILREINNGLIDIKNSLSLSPPPPPLSLSLFLSLRPSLFLSREGEKGRKKEKENETGS
jgi:hypothetical protein